MSTEVNNFPTVDDDLNTTAPQSKSDDWKMPEPVFRRTSGRLPKGFEKQYPVAVEERTESAQVDVTGQADVTAHAQPESKPKDPTVKLILVMLGIVAMIAFIAVFLTVVYVFFLRSESATP